MNREDKTAIILMVLGLLAWIITVALVTGRAIKDLQARVAALESKPCLMTGAHTGCER